MTENFQYSYENIKRLTDKELDELWAVYLKDKTNKAVRDKLIVQYLHLTKYVVTRVSMFLPQTFASDDIYGYATEGLIDAVEKFAPEKGAKFETYAIFRIRGSVIDKIRALDWMPRSVKRKVKEVNETSERLRKELGRAPTSTEIGNELGITREKVDAILAETSKVCSLYDKKNVSDESIEIIDTIEDSKAVNPLDSLEDKSVKQKLQSALQKLPERERTIMVLYYNKNMTLKEIGEIIEVSESRVCQLHAQAIMKLRNFFSEDKIGSGGFLNRSVKK